MKIVWLAFLHYYTHFSGFIAYVFILTTRIKISNTDLIFFLGLFLLLIIQFTLKDIKAFTLDLRFFWGWVIFYLIFKTVIIRKGVLNNALVLLSTFTIVEAILINTVLEAKFLPNFPDINNAAAHFVTSDYYQRPYSFGGSATVASSILVTLIAICDLRGWKFWLSVSAVLSFISGVGTLALLIVMLVKYRSLILKSSLPLLLMLTTTSILFYNVMSNIFIRFTDKISPEYIQFLFNDKLNTIISRYDELELYMMIIGYPRSSNEPYGGDFGLFSFVTTNGFVGFLLIFILVISRINKKNRLPLFVIILTSLHYPAILYLPGQMMFGLLLAINKNGLPNKSKIYNIRTHKLDT